MSSANALFLFVVRVRAEDEHEARRFYVYLASAMGLSGRHLPQHNFIMCNVMRRGRGEDGLAGMELCMQREALRHYRDVALCCSPVSGGVAA